jgi:hypothetical protein
METIGFGVIIIPSLMFLIGGIMFLVAAFSQIVWWGLGCLFVPFVNLIFLVFHWAKAKKSFLTQLAGLGLLLAVILHGGGGSMFNIRFAA